MREYYDKLGNLEIVDVYEGTDNMPTSLTFVDGRLKGEKLFKIKNEKGYTIADGYVREEHMQEAHTFMDYLKARA